jgi:hypothetical protein
VDWDQSGARSINTLTRLTGGPEEKKTILDFFNSFSIKIEVVLGPGKIVR